MPLLLNRLFLSRRASGISGRASEAEQGVRWLQVRANARLQQARRHLLHRAWRVAAPPQDEVGVGAEANATVTRRDDIWGRFLDHLHKRLPSLRPLLLGEAPPQWIGAHAEKLRKI